MAGGTKSKNRDTGECEKQNEQHEKEEADPQGPKSERLLVVSIDPHHPALRDSYGDSG